jgi:hypothetical protein
VSPLTLRREADFSLKKITQAITCAYGIEAYQKWAKIPSAVRIKDESSLVAKAFVLNKGWFFNYEDITDSRLGFTLLHY